MNLVAEHSSVQNGLAIFKFEVKLQAKVPLSTPRRRVGVAEVQCHTFLTSARDGGGLQRTVKEVQICIA